jgi:hypothetical protein
LELSQARGDQRQEARTLNCLGLMYCENGAVERAIPALQNAIAHCREGLRKAREKEKGRDSDEDAAADVEFWASGLIVCIANLGCVLTRTGHLQVCTCIHTRIHTNMRIDCVRSELGVVLTRTGHLQVRIHNIHTYTYTYMHTNTEESNSTDSMLHIHVCVCVYIYIYIYIYMYP